MSSSAHGNVNKNSTHLSKIPISRTPEYLQNKSRNYYAENKTDLSVYYKLRQYVKAGLEPEYVKEVFEKYDDKKAKMILRMKKAVLENSRISCAV